MNRSLFSVFLLLLSLGLAQADDIDLNNGLIGYWPLNGTAQDYSGNNYHGALRSYASFAAAQGSNRYVLQTAEDVVGEGYVAVDIPSSEFAEENESGYATSGSLWVMFDDLDSPDISITGVERSQGILKGAPGLTQIQRYKTTNAIAFGGLKYTNTSGSLVNVAFTSTANSVDTAGVWYHIAWTLLSDAEGDNGFIRCYINGVLNEEYTGNLIVRTDTGICIGSEYNRSSPNAKFAEVRLYKRILTADEIATLANPSAMNGDNVGFTWDAAHFPTADAPFAIDPSSLGLELTDAYGIPLSSYEDSSRIPDIISTIVSGPAIYNANGQLEFLGGGDVVIQLMTEGNAYYAPSSATITIPVSGTPFNSALWNDATGTGFFITNNDEAGVATFGEEAVRIDASGNVGIGVTQPQAALDVNGNTQVSGSLQAANGIVRVTQSGDLVINEGQANEIRLGADGSAHFPKYGDIKMLGDE